MKPIYEPKGKAKEYGDYALNIYTGCPHRCFYCFAPNVLHKDREAFYTNVEPRTDIVKATKQQLEKREDNRETYSPLLYLRPLSDRLRYNAYEGNNQGY